MRRLGRPGPVFCLLVAALLAAAASNAPDPGGATRPAGIPESDSWTAVAPSSLATAALVPSFAAAWRGARLVEAETARSERVAFYARRYGIGRSLSSQIYEAARAERVSPALAFSLVRVESEFDARAVGPSGSIGLTQLRPSTARELSPRVSAADLYSPRLNLRLGFRYLRSLLERFGHDTELALVAYNRGPGHVDALLARGLQPPSGFARKVLRNVERGSRAAL